MFSSDKEEPQEEEVDHIGPINVKIFQAEYESNTGDGDSELFTATAIAKPHLPWSQGMLAIPPAKPMTS